MAATAPLAAFEARANEVESQVQTLRTRVEQLRKIAEEREALRLQEENKELEKQIEAAKTSLSALEAANGLVQVPLPGATGAPVAAAAKVAVAPATSASSAADEPAAAPAPAATAPTQPKKTKAKKGGGGGGGGGGAAATEKPKDISRLNLRVGRIVEVAKHPDADSLYVEQVELGEESPRTVVSGLVNHIPIEEMQNRLVVLLTNLKPSKMRGVVSQAMVMCASTEEKVEILMPPKGSEPGDVVSFAGYENTPDERLNPKHKVFEAVAVDLQTNDGCVATYKGVPFTVAGKGEVTSQSLKNAKIK